MKLTPEQVGKLRLPEGYELVYLGGQWWLRYSTYPNGNETTAGHAMARLAEAVANDELPESVLIAAWAAREGKMEYYAARFGYETDMGRFSTEKKAIDFNGDEYGIIIKLGP